MQRAIRWFDYITTNIYFFGLTTLSQTNGLVIPLLIQGFVGEAQKATYLGNLRLWSLMVALLMQALFGMLSDRSTLSLGRRRPFILSGTLLNVVFVAATALLVATQGMTGYVLLFIVSIFQQTASNAAHAAAQGLIPDRVPENLRGRFSGVKAILEFPLPVIFVAFVIANIVKGGSLPLALAVAAGVLLLTMALTMLVPEQKLEGTPPPLDWAPFKNLLVMTLFFTAVILGLGQISAWVGTGIQKMASAGLVLGAMGILGLLSMLIAVGMGVYASIRISLGKEAQANRNFTWWVISRLAFLVGINNLSTFAVYYFQSRLGYAGTTAAGPAAQLVQVVGVMIFLSALPSGWLADRFGRKLLLVISGFAATVGTLIVLLTTSLTVIYIGGAVIGLASGLFFSANWAMGTSLVPKDQAARFLGLSNLAGAGAGAVGAYIGGPIADQVTASLPSVPGAGYALLFAIYACMFLFSVAAITRVRLETDHSPIPSPI